MYIIKSQTGKPKKTGDLYYNYRLVASVKEDGKVKRLSILSLGASFDIPKEKWGDLCHRIESILLGRNELFSNEQVDELLETTAQTLANKISKSGQSLPFGKDRHKKNLKPKDKYELINIDKSKVTEGYTIGAEHAALYGIDSLKIRELFKSLGFTDLQIQMVTAILTARMVNPASELETYRWLTHTSGLGYLLEIDFKEHELSSLYRANDLIYKHMKVIEHVIFNETAKLFNFNHIITLYDLTNTYFEGTPLSDKAKRGRSKEKRSDCLLITVGLVLDSCGFIRRSKFYAGNQSEPKTMEEIITGLEGSTESLVIMDRGIATAKNIKWLIEKNFKYLVVSRERNRSFDFSKASPIKTATEEIVSAYRIVNEIGDEAKLYCHSENREKKERAMLKTKMENFEKKLQKLNNNLNKKRCKKELAHILKKIGRIEQAAKGISQHYKITVLDNSQTKNSEDQLQATIILYEKILKPSTMATHPGVYCLKTNDMTLEAEEMWRTYMRLTEVESVFRSMKSELGLRPIYHWKEKRIEAHLFITLLAYQSVQVIRTKLKENNIYSSWETIRRELSCHQITTTEYQRKDGTVLEVKKANMPKLFQQNIYSALGIKFLPGGVTKTVK
jgi:hypothetical protein